MAPQHEGADIVPFCTSFAGHGDRGPHAYSSSDSPGFCWLRVQEIGRLFIAGFGSSMIFGTVVGSLADKQ